MAKTAVADIIIPTEFEKYAIERTAELSRFGESGIIEMAPEFDELAAGGGREVKMPFWKDLTATRQLLSDSGTLSVNKITSDQDIARIHNDAQVWSVNHLAKVISGDDPMQAIVDLVAGYWARIDEGLVISSLKGIFSAASMSGNLLAIHSEAIAGQSAATRLNGSTFVDACAKLGDAADRLTSVAMHSATEAALRKLDLIDFIPDSEGKAQLRTFQGRRVIVDDTLIPRAGTTDGQVYRTYLFGSGAFGKGVSPLDGAALQGGFGTEGVEMARVPLDSDTVLINRRRYILHPRGVKFTSASVAADSPTNAELENGANWTRVFENKNVRGRYRPPLLNKMFLKLIKKIMGKIFPHSSLKARTGSSVSTILGKVLDLSDEHFPLKKTLGGDPIEVMLEPGVYLLLASFCVNGVAAGDTIRGRFCDAVEGPEIPVAGVFHGGISITGNPQLFQFSAFLEVNAPQRIQFWLACDQERGELHGGYNSTVQTGISWAKL